MGRGSLGVLAERCAAEPGPESVVGIVADAGHDETPHEGTVGTERRTACDGPRNSDNMNQRSIRTQAAYERRTTGEGRAGRAGAEIGRQGRESESRQDYGDQGSEKTSSTTNNGSRATSEPVKKAIDGLAKGSIRGV